MAQAPHEKALGRYIRAALVDAGVEPNKVVRARQKRAPEPARPFVTFNVLSLNPVGQTARRVTTNESDDGGQTYGARSVTAYRGTCTISIHAQNHWELLLRLTEWRNTPLGERSAVEHGLAVGRPLSLLNGNTIAGPEWEQRSQADLPFSWSSDLHYTTPVLDETATINPIANLEGLDP